MCEVGEAGCGNKLLAVMAHQLLQAAGPNALLVCNIVSWPACCGQRARPAACPSCTPAPHAPLPRTYTLCYLQTRRSNIDAFKGFHGADAAAVEVTPEDAAALRSVRVTFIPAGCESAPAGNKSQTVAPAPAAAAAPAAAGGRDSRDGRDRRERSRSRDRRERRRSRSRERSRDRRRSRSRDRRRSRSRDRRRSRSRDRRRSRSRDRRRSRSRSRDRRPRDSERAAAGAAAAVAAGAPPPSTAGQQQQQQPGEERVDVQSTSGAVLECTREDKPVGEQGCRLMLARPCWTLACEDVSRRQDASAGAIILHSRELARRSSLGCGSHRILPAGHYVLELQRVAQEALVSELACSRVWVDSFRARLEHRRRMQPA